MTRPNLKALQAEIKNAKKRINNLIKAIEDGIYTASTKARHSELESQKKSLEESLALEQISTPIISKEALSLWFRRFLNQDHNDPGFRARLIEMFVHKVYLYDDKNHNYY
ncbi:MAG: hypothetical protein IJV88_06160 [Ruminococcus sp.]|nr:hypothetical protein [Ruminococcus sp.]